MAAARSFRELKAYQAARDAARLVFDFSKHFPREEQYSLTDQIRRSSRAVKALLAEAWARRRYKAAFVNKIDEALGEAYETQSWWDDALDGQYFPHRSSRTSTGGTMRSGECFHACLIGLMI